MKPAEPSPGMLFTGKGASLLRMLHNSVLVPILIWGMLFGALAIAAYTARSSPRRVELYAVPPPHLILDAASAETDPAQRRGQ